MDPFNPHSLFERLEPETMELDQSSTPPVRSNTSTPPDKSAEKSSTVETTKTNPSAVKERRSSSMEPQKNANYVDSNNSSRTSTKLNSVFRSVKAAAQGQASRPSPLKKDGPISFEEALMIGGGSNMPAKAPKAPKLPPPKQSATGSSLASLGISQAKSNPSLAAAGVKIETTANAASNTANQPSLQPSTFATKLEALPRRNPLAFGVGGSLALSRRPCHDFFYRELLVTRYLSLRNRSEPLKRELEQFETTGVDDRATENGDSRESSPPLLKGEPDAMVVAESVKKALRIRSVAIPEAVDDEAENEEGGIEFLPDKFDCEPRKKQLLVRLVRVISGQRLADCTAEGLDQGFAVRHVSLQRNAALLRKAFSTITSADMRQAAWAHGCLLQSLPLPFLATYLQLLRHMRQLAPGLTEFVTGHGAGQGETEAVKDANQLARRLIFQKVTDPMTVTAAKFTPKKLSGNIHLVLVPPTLQHLGKMKQRAHEYFYKVLLPMIGQTHWVKFVLPNRNYTVAETADFMLVNIRDTVMEVKKNHRDAKIVLVGWGTSCLLNCKIVQELSAISAVINLAFPVVCANGSRGDVDDDILTVTAPSLFVVGQFACDSSFDALQDLRDHMRSESGLIVVGSANSNLHISPRKLLIERLTLRAVHRVILDHMLEYLDQTLNRPPPKPLKFSKPLPALSVDIPLASTNNATVGSSPQKKPRRKSQAQMEPPKTAPPLSDSSSMPAELIALLASDPDKPKAPLRLLSTIDATIHPFPIPEPTKRKRRTQSTATVDESGEPVPKVRKPRPSRPRKPPINKQMSEQGPSPTHIDPTQRRHTIAEFANSEQRRGFMPVSPQSRTSLAQGRFVTTLSSQGGPPGIRYAPQPQGQQVSMRPAIYRQQHPIRMSGVHVKTSQLGATSSTSASPPVLSNELSGSPSASTDQSDSTRSAAPVDPSFFYDPRQSCVYKEPSPRLSHVSYAHMPVVHSNRLMASYHQPTFDELAHARRKP